jgi:ATP-dependent DNA helicase RecQ
VPGELGGIERVARERFGFESLRVGQAEAVRSLLDGRDTLVVMPTGSGKSAIYQIAAVMLAEPTVVVSPLIALQRDQAAALDEVDAGAAAEANSLVGAAQRREALEDLREGDLEFLFLAPEQFANPATLEGLASSATSLFVVDEAHCVSAWGHDFRPDYLRLGSIAELLGRPTIAALTATASPPVRAEIVELLGMRNPNVIVRGFDRPNISLAGRSFHRARDKTDALVEGVAAAQPPGIVYTATRRGADELAERLRGEGVEARSYHAGLRAGERTAVQEAFMDDAVAVVVATVAFGMGIDKSNVRFVWHHDVPDSLDSLYQEIGRAGRDGEPAEAVLFYRAEDLGLRRFFAGGGLGAGELRAVLEEVKARPEPRAPEALGRRVRLSRTKLASALALLDRVGAVDVLPGGAVQPRPGVEAGDAAERAAEADAVHRRVDRSRIEMMRAYAETDDCRREFLLNYFGEPFDPPCGNCDNCARGAARGQPDAGSPWREGARVAHRSWGEGLVMRLDGDKVVVLFDRVGYKILSLEAVRNRGLLRSA